MTEVTPLDQIRVAIDSSIATLVSRQENFFSSISPHARPLLDTTAPMLAKGKRVRAALTWWGYELAQQALAANGRALDTVAAPAGIAPAAASLELLQAAALIHDDIIDRSQTRRGMPAVHAGFAQLHADEDWIGAGSHFGLSAGIIAGDLCLGWCEELYSRSALPRLHEPSVTAVRDDLRTEVMVGQYLDVLIQAEGSLDARQMQTRAWQVLTHKSAKYTMEQPLRLGAALGGADAELDRLAQEFGRPLGQAFQLRDDVLGVFGDPSQTGKPAGDDLREGKRTLLLGFALEFTPAGSSDHELLALVGTTELDAAQIAAVTQILEASGALARTESEIARLGGQARDALAQFGRLGVRPEMINTLDAFALEMLARRA